MRESLCCHTDKMKLSAVFAFIFRLFIDHVSGKLIQATVADDVKFTFPEECKNGKAALYHHLKDGTDQLVASLDGVWKPGPDYINRLNQSSDSLVLKSADFNDEGHYAFSCKEELEELHLFLPSEVVVSEWEDATLTCRSITAGQWVKSVRWRRNGETVLKLNARTGEVTYGNGFDGSRVSIPSDWDRRADLSLTIKRAEVKDGGVYYCDIDKEEKHRAAVRLQVRLGVPITPPGTPHPTAAQMPTECPHWTWTTFFITAGMFAVVGLLAWLVWCLRSRKFKECTQGFGEGSLQQHEEEETDLKDVRISNGGGPLCNSKEEEEGGSEEDRESDCDQQNKQMLKSNRYH